MMSFFYSIHSIIELKAILQFAQNTEKHTITTVQCVNMETCWAHKYKELLVLKPITENVKSSAEDENSSVKIRSSVLEM